MVPISRQMVQYGRPFKMGNMLTYKKLGHATSGRFGQDCDLGKVQWKANYDHFDLAIFYIHVFWHLNGKACPLQICSHAKHECVRGPFFHCWSYFVCSDCVFDVSQIRTSIFWICNIASYFIKLSTWNESIQNYQKKYDSLLTSVYRLVSVSSCLLVYSATWWRTKAKLHRGRGASPSLHSWDKL